MKSKKITGEIQKFIRDKAAKAGRQGGVIGVSGGLDSAVCLYLTANALGKSNTYPLFLPSQSFLPSQRENRLTECVQNLCSALGTGLKIYNLENIIDCYLQKFNSATKIQCGNFTARVRTAFLYAEAEKRGLLVINTGNLSETMVGYFTKWGDGAGDISPIGGLYKTEVYELAKYLNVPGQIIAAPPTAGFFKGQTDEGELGMNYEKLDSILKHLERGEKGKSPIYDKDEVVKVKSLIKKSAHKRDEIPVPDLDRE